MMKRMSLRQASHRQRESPAVMRRRQAMRKVIEPALWTNTTRTFEFQAECPRLPWYQLPSTVLATFLYCKLGQFLDQRCRCARNLSRIGTLVGRQASRIPWPSIVGLAKPRILNLSAISVRHFILLQWTGLLFAGIMLIVRFMKFGQIIDSVYWPTIPCICNIHCSRKPALSLDIWSLQVVKANTQAPLDVCHTSWQMWRHHRHAISHFLAHWCTTAEVVNYVDFVPSLSVWSSE